MRNARWAAACGRIARHAAFAPLLAACLALCVGLVDLAKPLDRGMGGWQGAFFSLAARGYESHGALEHRGHPSIAIHGGRISADDLRRAPDGAWVYANHPPVAPLLAWAEANGWIAGKSKIRYKSRNRVVKRDARFGDVVRTTTAKARGGQEFILLRKASIPPRLKFREIHRAAIRDDLPKVLNAIPATIAKLVVEASRTGGLA